MFRTSWAQLNRHISVAERRLAQQRVLIDRLAAAGRGTDGANKLQDELQQQLDTLVERRRKILAPRAGRSP